MAESLMSLATALWLGILTSISPCPLATNIAAISYIGRRVEKPRHVLLSGLLYTLGRAITYVFLGIILVTSLLSAPYVSQMLQKHMNRILGPILILVGMFLLELIAPTFGGAAMTDTMRGRIEKMGLGGAGALGILFALSFCPVSAALFFGSLLPLAVTSGSGIVLPSVYGIGTALPVVLFAILIALGISSIGKMFSWVMGFEKFARRITGVVFIGIGIYFCLAYIFGVFQ